MNLSSKFRKEILSLRFLLLAAVILLAISISIIIVTFLTRNTSQTTGQNNESVDTTSVQSNTQSSDTSVTQDPVNNQQENNVQEENVVKTSAVNIPEDWSIFESCGVRVPLPPQKPPYYVLKTSEPTREQYTNDENSGRYWTIIKRPVTSDFDRGDEISLSYNFDGVLGRGFIPSLVYVQCNENVNKISLEEYLNQLQEELKTNNEVGIALETQEKINKFGVEVYKLTFKGGFYAENEPYYYFVNSKYLYRITSVTMLEKEFVKETNKQILDNITFL